MVVMWCRACGSLIGLREPFQDWAADRTGLCPPCAGKMLRDQPGKENAPDGSGEWDRERDREHEPPDEE